MSNFTLVILKYTNSKNVISYEREFINLLKPDYNINLIGNSTKRYKRIVKKKKEICEIALSNKDLNKIK